MVGGAFILGFVNDKSVLRMSNRSRQFVKPPYELQKHFLLWKSSAPLLSDPFTWTMDVVTAIFTGSSLRPGRARSGR